MKKYLFCLLFIVLCLLCTPFARADYVLPYPSYMPGNKLYRVSRIFDSLKNYWYWGNIAQAKYHMNLTDKYLVEAKILFEYKQYLLAADALSRSDDHAGKIISYIKKAAAQGKDTKALEKTLIEAMSVHKSVLDLMRQQLPEEFVWRPEKGPETNIPIASQLMHSTQLRQAIYAQL